MGLISSVEMIWQLVVGQVWPEMQPLRLRTSSTKEGWLCNSTVCGTAKVSAGRQAGGVGCLLAFLKLLPTLPFFHKLL